MMKQTFKTALLAALITAILTIPALGLRLKLEGFFIKLDADLGTVLLACAAIFVFQLVKPAVSRPLYTAWSSIRHHLPRPDPSPAVQRSIWLVVLLLALALPFFASRGMISTFTLALIYVVLGLGLNITVGFAGLLDLGYVAFYAVGAYTFALLQTIYGLSFWQCLPIAALMAALFGLSIGFPVLRLRGDYLAIVTLGFGEIIRRVLNNLTITGGPTGLTGLDKPSVFGLEMARSASVEGATTFHELLNFDYQGIHMVIYLYLIALLLAVFAFYFTGRLIRMPIGRAWEALRDDEIACRSLGLNPTWIKLSAFMLGASFAGLAGCFFASRQGMVNPDSFTFPESALMLSIVVLGGMGSRIGVVLAAILLTVLPEIARDFSEYRMLIFGLVMVLMMIWRPQGLWPARRRQVALR